MNIEQSKHLANSARIIGMAQFAAYGYKAMNAHPVDQFWLLGSAVFYVAVEVIAFRLLERAS
ncbi:MAG: hypothetical protein GXP11_05890 [Gammaproteobacteria bacterium]|nr:hypothetical protein [Gammaproteobacteria bacterium]